MVKTNLDILCVQADLAWEDIDANLTLFETLINQNKKPVDLILLPEMFNSGFTMNTQNCAEPMHGKTMKWMKHIAIQTSSVICGSLIIKEDNKFYNRIIWQRRDGSYSYYDKRHLFSMAGEDNVFTPGKEKLIVEINGWKICPLICYDLRFPVWSRNTEEYDILIYLASWPKIRAYAWNTLLKARAIENQSYVIGVNRVGKDGNSFEYTGDTVVIDPAGISVSEIKNKPGLLSAKLSKTVIIETRTKLPFINDRDNFNIN